MPGRMVYTIPVTIESIKHRVDVVEQHKDPVSGTVRTHSIDLGYYAILADGLISLYIGEVDPHIKPGTHATLQLVVPME